MQKLRIKKKKKNNKKDKVTASGQTQSTWGIPAIKESPNLKHQGSGVRNCLGK